MTWINRRWKTDQAMICAFFIVGFAAILLIILLIGLYQACFGQGLEKGKIDLTFIAGGGKGAGTPEQPFMSGIQTHDLALSAIDIGYVLTDKFFKEKFYEFNFEPIVELVPFGLQYSPTTRHFAGGSILGRFNFTNNENKRLVPYLTGGVGMSLTDIGRPDLAGLREFNYQLGGGAKWFVTKNLAVDTRLAWYHLSCCGILRDDGERRNNGVNSLLLLGGISIVW